MFYVEASPRWGAYDVGGNFFHFVCGFEFNLISKDNASEGWDKFDAKYISLGPVCHFDANKTRPQINGSEFVDCEYTGTDEEISWEVGPQYEVSSISDILTIPSASSSVKDSKVSDSRAETDIGPADVGLEEVYLRYRTAEALHFRNGDFLLKGCE